MYKLNKESIKELMDLCLSFAALSGLIISCQVDDHLKAVHHHDHIVKIARHKRYIRHLKYVRLWSPVWKAHNHPSAKDLSELTINHPWRRAIIYVNHDRPTINPHSWKYDHIKFAHKDKLGRVSSSATAYLARGNATGDALRIPQKVKPVGWHQHKYNGDYTLNRGHLIAYSLSKDINFKGRHTYKAVGNQNDPNNLFTETAFCNQQLQYTFETRIRMALERNKRIIYQVQPIFRGHELMARGVHLQAISTDKRFKLNVYLFNIQPGVKFNYQTGKAHFSPRYQYDLPNELIQKSQNLDKHDKDMKWQRKIMHLYDEGLITYQQASFDESLLLGGYVLKY